MRFTPEAGLSLQNEVERLVAHGASVIEKVHRGWGIGEVILADPEGNFFAVESSDKEAVEAEKAMISTDREAGGPFWEDAVLLPRDASPESAFSRAPAK